MKSKPVHPDIYINFICLMQRKTSTPPEKSPARKRQRNPVKRFDIDEEVQKSARKRRMSGEVLFDRGSYLAVRADRGGC